MRKEGFYKVKVKEHGPAFWTIGLWTDYGSSQAWLFAQGDGDEMSAGFEVIEVIEEMIALDMDVINPHKPNIVEGETFPGTVVKCWETGSYSKEEGPKHFMNVLIDRQGKESVHQMIELP